MHIDELSKFLLLCVSIISATNKIEAIVCCKRRAVRTNLAYVLDIASQFVAANVRIRAF